METSADDGNVVPLINFFRINLCVVLSMLFLLIKLINKRPE